MKRIFTCLLMLCVWTTTYAKEIEKVNFPEEASVGTQKLVLNGAGLRTKKKFGMNFKVYVGALYLPAKSADAAAIIAAPGTKILEMVFLRAVDRETLQEAWKESYDKNCASECDSARDHFKSFNDMMVDVKENSRLKMTFDKDGVSVDISMVKTPKKAQIVGEPFRKALMAMFIGEHPALPEFKAALLGK